MWNSLLGLLGALALFGILWVPVFPYRWWRKRHNAKIVKQLRAALKGRRAVSDNPTQAELSLIHVDFPEPEIREILGRWKF